MIGALTGEVVRRATGHTLREVCEERVRAPYGMDFLLRLPESEEPRFRAVQPMLPTPEQQALPADRVAHAHLDRLQHTCPHPRPSPAGVEGVPRRSPCVGADGRLTAGPAHPLRYK